MRFVEPNLPDGRVRLVIADRNAPDELFSYLDKRNIKYIKSLYVKNCIDAVSTHPDMQICNLGGGNFVCEPSTYEYYKKALGIYGANVSSGEISVGCNYPNDIAYNVVIAGNLLMHNTSHTEPEILKSAKHSGFSICNVKQGYTKCAVCIVSDRAFITSDYGIYKACLQNSADCLLIPEDGIMLGKRTDGFIGGCCGLISDRELLFCGNFSRLKSRRMLEAFLNSHGVSPVSAYDGPIADIGSIIPVMQE